jgi:sugar phosphate isomerase/epimerase
MDNIPAPISRRDFSRTLATAAASLAAAPLFAATKPAAPMPRIKLGYDNFAVRAMGWKAPQLIDYAARLKTDSLFITDLGPFEKFDDAYLGELRQQAAGKGLQIHLGSWSICPTSRRFKKDWGTAEEHLALGIRMAKALGSPVFRVILGAGEDRLTDGGISARIADTVKVLKSQRSRALDAGVKIAVENHAGDMHSLELVQLIEAAGRDYVGANMDSGNALWTLEEPLQTLENLGPYTLTTSLRDSAVWESADGVTVQWTAMGEGQVDWKKYFARFAVLCPGVPVHIETISGFNRELTLRKEEFWKAWPGGKPKGYDQFLAFAKRGTPRAPWKAPADKDRKLADQEYQCGDVERSIAFCKKLGLGSAT